MALVKSKLYIHPKTSRCCEMLINSYRTTLYRVLQNRCPNRSGACAVISVVQNMHVMHAVRGHCCLSSWEDWQRTGMPNPYSLDLRWRIIWVHLAQNRSPREISTLLNVSERTVRRYTTMFYQTGDVVAKPRRSGPQRLLGDFEQLKLMRLIFENPGIYLYELQRELSVRGICVSDSTICRTLRYMGCTRQAMHQVALQQSDASRARFMAEISVYDPSMLVFLDESGCDRRHTIRKYGYSLRGMPMSDRRILIRGTRYSVIPILSLEGIHDCYITDGTVNGEKFTAFVRDCLLPVLLPFNWTNPRSVVVMDNASIHHVDNVTRLIEGQCGAKLCYLPPYSPDLMPAEGVFSQIKSIMKENYKLFQVCSSPRSLLVMAFGMVSVQDCRGHISRCGYN